MAKVVPQVESDNSGSDEELDVNVDDEVEVLPPAAHNVPATQSDSVTFGAAAVASDATSSEADLQREKLLQTMAQHGYSPAKVLDMHERSAFLNKIAKMSPEQLRSLEQFIVAETRAAPADMFTTVINKCLHSWIAQVNPNLAEHLFKPEVLPRIINFLYSITVGQLSPVKQAVVSTAATLVATKYIKEVNATQPTPVEEQFAASQSCGLAEDGFRNRNKCPNAMDVDEDSDAVDESYEDNELDDEVRDVIRKCVRKLRYAKRARDENSQGSNKRYKNRDDEAEEIDKDDSASEISENEQAQLLADLAGSPVMY